MITVRPPVSDDYDEWRSLYRGYAEFYRVQQTDEMALRVWSWLMDPDHEVEGLVAQVEGGPLVGLAHYRAFARPLSATTGGYLDDLYVEPASRGSGVVDALLSTLRELAGDRGWSVVRWITADDNHRARAKYEQVATQTPWVTYDMAPQVSRG